MISVARQIFFAFICISSCQLVAQQQDWELNPRFNISVNDVSSLVIHGSSNVNEFTCKLGESFNGDTIVLMASWENEGIYFKDARLSFPVRSFQCNHKAMTEDFWKTLNAANYPEIYFKVNKIFLDQNDETPTEVEAEVEFTISGKSRKEILKFKSIQITKNELSFEGSKELTMTGFGIEPPSPLFGLIQVEDRLNVQFDFLFHLIKKTGH